MQVLNAILVAGIARVCVVAAIFVLIAGILIVSMTLNRFGGQLQNWLRKRDVSDYMSSYLEAVMWACCFAVFLALAIFTLFC